MCIRDRYQRRVHGELNKKENNLTRKLLPSLLHLPSPIHSLPTPPQAMEFQDLHFDNIHSNEKVNNYVDEFAIISQILREAFVDYDYNAPLDIDLTSNKVMLRHLDSEEELAPSQHSTEAAPQPQETLSQSQASTSYNQPDIMRIDPDFPFKIKYTLPRRKFDTKNIVKNFSKALMGYVNSRSGQEYLMVELQLNSIEEYEMVRDRIIDLITKSKYNRKLMKELIKDDTNNIIFRSFLKNYAYGWILNSTFIKDKYSHLRARRNLLYICAKYKTIDRFSWNFQYNFLQRITHKLHQPSDQNGASFPPFFLSSHTVIKMCISHQ
eukprot:TRINITY_DN41_c0_g2_i1.p1 TRINITY_DN41_c0_g2~~TRINITY_DN41_c0_g2_i1.p1  ORF type:complete len:323 (+),score=124.24 TRINITY_DN41_c0_g2_i1:65-1033(+)